MSSSVLIALNEPFVRIGVQVTLDAEVDFTVVGHVDAVGAILPAVADRHPDILVLDDRFQRADPGLMQAVLEAHPACRVLMLVDHTDAECTVRQLHDGPRNRWPDREAIDNLRACCLLAFRESARGCLPRASEPALLVKTLRSIVDGEAWAGPSLSRYLLDMAGPAEREQKQRLTKRELDVIGLLVEGLSNKEIAARLTLSEQTIKNHIARIMVKVEVRNRVELVLYAVRERLV
jgi:DNA-binding NarL/FixJ family response regulator